MISQTAEYALRAIVCLANHGGVPCTTSLLSEETQTPAGYLAKVMQALCRAGLVKSRPGLNGGFTLKRPPEELTILEIVGAVDPIRRYHQCPLGLVQHGRHLCPLHSRLDEAAELVEKVFADATVADLLETPRERRSCPFPIGAKAASRNG